MTDKEKAARAIGYLEGVGAFLGCICSEPCIRYESQVELLRKTIFDDEVCVSAVRNDGYTTHQGDE